MRYVQRFVVLCFLVYADNSPKDKFTAWICNYIHIKLWDVITHCLLVYETRRPVFWDTPTATWFHIRSQGKTRQSQSYKFKKKLPKIQILQKTLHATHLLKWLDKMYKYEMDPTRTVGATEQTQDAGRTGGWMDGLKPIYPPTTSLCGV